ncbi:MAG TPA: hypothetical protein EYN06_02820 [Myxococcales bacterium]|nr:hypothetical protein [Myxococcales bacterium]HIN85387.1 hypothetical protein [Myxococcales bacterium]
MRAGNEQTINKIRIRQWIEADTQWLYESLMVQASCDGTTWVDQWEAGGLASSGDWDESVRP